MSTTEATPAAPPQDGHGDAPASASSAAATAPRSSGGASDPGHPPVSDAVASSVLWKMIYGFAAMFHYCLTTLNLARQAFSVDGERRRALPRQRIRWEPNEVRIVYLLALKDKISFVLGVANLVFVAWLLGAYPEYFYLLYSVEVPLVIAYRLYRYRRIKQHYYLFDFCYWVNALLLFYIWIDRSSYMLFQALWLFTMGPLSWSVMTFGNSLVFHSSDKMSSIAIHLLPSWTCYTIRWMMPPSAGFHYCEYDPDAAAGAAACRADLRDMYLWAALPYMAWLLFYYVFVFVVRAKKVSERGYQTLYGWLMSSNAYRRHPIRRFVETVKNPYLQKLIYMSTHLGFTILTGFLCIAYWQYRWLNTAFLIAMFGVSLWNGGTYYIDYFSKQYQRIMQQSVVHAPAAQQQQASAMAERAADLMRAATVQLPSQPDNGHDHHD